MNHLSFRLANENDVDLFFNWANDKVVRDNSYNKEKIEYNSHVKWFNNKIKSIDCKFYVFLNKLNEEVGQVRIENLKSETIIGISIDENHRGHNYAVEMLLKATADFFNQNPNEIIVAYIKINNVASYKSFIKSGFGNEEIVEVNNEKSFKLYKKYESSN